MCRVSPWSSDTVCWCCWTSEPGRCACCPGCGRCTRSSSVRTAAGEGSGPAGWSASWLQRGYRSGWRARSEDTPGTWEKRMNKGTETWPENKAVRLSGMQILDGRICSGCAAGEMWQKTKTDRKITNQGYLFSSTSNNHLRNGTTTFTELSCVDNDR